MDLPCRHQKTRAPSLFAAEIRGARRPTPLGLYSNLSISNGKGSSIPSQSFSLPLTRASLSLKGPFGELAESTDRRERRENPQSAQRKSQDTFSLFSAISGQGPLESGDNATRETKGLFFPTVASDGKSSARNVSI